MVSSGHILIFLMWSKVVNHLSLKTNYTRNVVSGMHTNKFSFNILFHCSICLPMISFLSIYFIECVNMFFLNSILKMSLDIWAIKLPEKDQQSIILPIMNNTLFTCRTAANYYLDIILVAWQWLLSLWMHSKSSPYKNQIDTLH